MHEYFIVRKNEMAKWHDALDHARVAFYAAVRHLDTVEDALIAKFPSPASRDKNQKPLNMLDDRFREMDFGMLIKFQTHYKKEMDLSHMEKKRMRYLISSSQRLFKKHKNATVFLNVFSSSLEEKNVIDQHSDEVNFLKIMIDPAPFHEYYVDHPIVYRSLFLYSNESDLMKHRLYLS